jgi:hypothetical protein
LSTRQRQGGLPILLAAHKVSVAHKIIIKEMRDAIAGATRNDTQGGNAA